MLQEHSRSSVPIASILPVRPRLKLILIRCDRDRASHPLQLALHVVMQMLLLSIVRRSGGRAGLFVVQDGRWGRSCVAADRGVEVASVADGASCGAAPDRGPS